MWTQEQEKLSVSQRLSAVFLVVELGKHQPVHNNPFVALLEQVGELQRITFLSYLCMACAPCPPADSLLL